MAKRVGELGPVPAVLETNPVVDEAIRALNKTESVRIFREALRKAGFTFLDPAGQARFLLSQDVSDRYATAIIARPTRTATEEWWVRTGNVRTAPPALTLDADYVEVHFFERVPVGDGFSWSQIRPSPV